MTDFALLKEALAGVHNYLPTPFLPDYRLDADGMRDNVAFHAAAGNEDLIVTVGGAYGEGFALDLEEHKESVAAAVDGAQGRVQVMAGVVGGYGIQRRMARNAEDAGAGSLIVFFSRTSTPTAESAYSYFRDLAESVSVGVVVFPFGAHEFWPEVLERLAVVPNIIGYLPSSVSFGNAVDALVPGRYLWIAENEPFAMKSFPHGCRAYTTAAAAIMPEASRQFWRYGVEGDQDQMMEVFEQRIAPVLKIRTMRPGYGISGVKVALELLGRSGGPTRPPETLVADHDRRAIADILVAHPEVGHLLRRS